jgi:hypothetical protein
MAAEFQRSITLESFFAMIYHFCQQYESIAYFVKLVQNGGSIQNGDQIRFLA